MNLQINRVIRTFTTKDFLEGDFPYQARTAVELIDGLSPVCNFKGTAGLEKLLNNEVIIIYIPRGEDKKSKEIRGILKSYKVEHSQYSTKSYNTIKLTIEGYEEKEFIDGVKCDLDASKYALGLICFIKLANSG